MSWPDQKYVKFPFVKNQNLQGINGLGTNSISIGKDAGYTNNGTNAIAIGNLAGYSSQGLQCVALGITAGSVLQGNNAVAIGPECGTTSQGNNATAIGRGAASFSQGTVAVAVGNYAGQTNQGFAAVSVGHFSGSDNQREYAVAIGREAGRTNQGTNAVAIGFQAGQGTQGQNSISIGVGAGRTAQNSAAIAIGYFSGQTNQGTGSIAIGLTAGQGTQGQNAVAIGNQAGVVSQGSGGIAIGFQAGGNSLSTQGVNSISIGVGAGRTAQNSGAIAIGYLSGQSNQGTGSIAIGLTAGQGTQGQDSVAIGNSSGVLQQGSNAVAIGSDSGSQYQGLQSIAIGINAGRYTQGSNAIAIGTNAGNTFQGSFSIAIGAGAATGTQGGSSIAIGPGAGRTNQGSSSVSLGPDAAAFLQGGSSIAIGSSAGRTAQGSGSIAIGINAGSSFQSTSAIAIGNAAGSNTQGSGGIAIGVNAQQTTFTLGINAIAIGSNAGRTAQGSGSIAIGLTAGQGTQGQNSVAIGVQAGQTGQGQNSVAIGNQAGSVSEGSGSIAIGFQAGQNTQGENATAIGVQAGQTNQGANAIAIGVLSGNINQGSSSVAIGAQSGRNTQGENSVAIGVLTGVINQGNGAVAIGLEAGQNTQGQNAIAIGNSAGKTNQHSNSIILNASGTTLNSDGTNRTFIDPIRENQTNILLQYNTTTKEVSYSSSSTAGSVGELAARQIDSSYIEMNGQIVSQATYPTLYSAIGNQPEYKFNRTNLNPGLFPFGNVAGIKPYGNQNVARNGNTIIMVGVSGLIYRSIDNGINWIIESFNLGLFNFSIIRYISVWSSPTGTGMWVIGGSGSNAQGYSTDDGRTWIAPSSGNYNRYSFGFNPSTKVGIFVGSNSNIYRSANGTTWSLISNPLQTLVLGFTTFPILFSISYGNIGGVNTWVATGDRSTLIYSVDDGLTWTIYSFPTILSSTLFDSIYIGGTIQKFYAVGVDEIFYSSNGISWTRLFNASWDTMYQITTDTSETCVVIASSTRVIYSTDGTTFSFITSLIGDSFAITYNNTNTTFYACGDGGIQSLLYSSGTFATALVRSTLSRAVFSRCITLNNGDTTLYIGTESGGVLNYTISSSAIGTSVEPGYDIRKVEYGNNVWVAISLNGRCSVFYSSDAINWNYVCLDILTLYTLVLYDIQYINSRFVITANGTGLWESTDGSTWTLRSTATLNKYVVQWTGTNYLIGCNEGRILYSSDLLSYTLITLFSSPSTGASLDVWDIIHLGGGVCVACLDSGWIARSTDHGVTWTTQYLPTATYNFINLAYNSSSNILCTCTREGTIVATSFNQGVNWTLYEAPALYSGATFQGIVFGNGVFIVYGSINMIGISTDGLNWEWVAVPGGYDIISIAFSETDGVFMGAGLFNSTAARTPPVVLWSVDGINWTVKVVPHSLILVALSPKQVVTFGGNKWFIPSYVNTKSSIVWQADNPYNFSTQFQIPIKYLGTGTSKLWIKAT